MTGRHWTGFALSTVGLLVLLTRGDLDTLRRLEFNPGDLILIAAQPLWGLYSVMLKHAPKELPSSVLLWLTFTLGCAMMLPLLAIEMALMGAPALTWRFVASEAYLAVFAALLANLFWAKGLPVVGASQAGQVTYLYPIFGIAFALLFLSESFYLFHAIGIVTILAGVAIATSAARQPQSVSRP
jgi:drug/metabolite transporter (DMT)-like permease